MNFKPNEEKFIIAVTGSAGKTTVKTLVAAVLREKWIIFESSEYYNTTDKTELHVNQINYIHRGVVLEYGMAYPGVISKHCKIIRPNIGIITNVGLSHIGNFESDIEKLAASKSELIEGMYPKGLLFLNADDENSKLLHTNKFQGKIFTVGIKNEAQYKAKEVKFLEDGMNFSITLDGTDHNFDIPLYGEHNVYNALFAIGVANILGFNAIEIQTGFNNMKKPKHRLNIYHLKKGITLIDDTIHAYPASMKAAIDVLTQIGKGKKIAILGRMTELGEKRIEFHEYIGSYVASKNLDYLYTYGNTSFNISNGALNAGLPSSRIKHYANSNKEAMNNDLLKIIDEDSTILVKGASQLNLYDTVLFLKNYYKINQ